MCPVHQPGKRREKTQEQLRYVTSRIKAFVYDIKRGDDLIDGYCFIGNFTKTTVSIFSPERLPAASPVYVVFESAEGTNYRGVVVEVTRLTPSQRVIGSNASTVLLKIRLMFGSEAERQRYLKYVSELKAAAILIKPGMKF